MSQDQYRNMKKVIACFVTERKHRALKAAALYVLRHIEHTSLLSLVSQQCELIIEGHSLFQPEFLVNPSPVDISLLNSVSTHRHRGGKVVFAL